MGYSFIVVDDEKNLADATAYAIKNGLDEDLNVEVFYNSEEALQYFQSDMVDVAVCDINMPKLDGLALAEKMQKINPELQIIFLTGYDDFSYTYKALKLNNVSYVLKLEDEEVLLKNCREKVAAVEKARINKLELLRKESVNLLLKKHIDNETLKNILLGRETNFHDFEIGALVLFVLKSNNQWTKLLSLINEIFITRKRVYTSIETGVYFFVFDNEEKSSLTLKKIEYLQQLLFDAYEESSVTVYDFSFTVNTPMRIRYYDMLNAALKNINESALSILNFANFTANYSYNDRDNTEIIKKSKKYIDALDFDALCILADQIHNKVKSGVITHMQFYYYVNELLTTLYSRYGGIFKANNKSLLDYGSYNENAEKCLYVFKSALLVLKESLAVKKETYNVISIISQYIEANLGEELTLGNIADYVHYNPSYLSRYFKQTTGKNLSTYIMEKRIEYAKCLLANSDEKIKDICLKAGFASPTQFGLTFARFVGMPPNVFRKTNNE